MALSSTIAFAYLFVSRWKLSMQPLPDKVIVIGAPHTSNWDGEAQKVFVVPAAFRRLCVETSPLLCAITGEEPAAFRQRREIGRASCRERV